MKTISFHIEVVILILLSLIQWPDPSILTLNCPWNKSRIVRKIILKKLVPILERYKASFPLDCPFHASRDLYGVDKKGEADGLQMWTCKICGLKFTTEQQFVDHLEADHIAITALHEGAVCLADYCAIMRCHILMGQDDDDKELPVPFVRGNTKSSVDNALAEERRISDRDVAIVSESVTAPAIIPSEEDLPSQGSNGPKITTPASTATESPSPPPPVLSPSRDAINTTKVCKESDLKDLHKQCQTIIRSCIMGLLLNLSPKDFQEIEEDMDRAICAYLTCEKFWEDPLGEEHHFSMGFFLALLGMLTAGTFLCYYIVWVVFEYVKAEKSPGDGTTHKDCYEVYVLYSEHLVPNTKSGPKYEVRRKVVQR